jgi:Caspase domain
VSVRAVDPARSRIVLVGAPVYDDPALADVPQIAQNLADLVSVFTDAKLGGFPAEHCVSAPPDATVDQVGDILEAAAEQAEDLLLFYFVGHGLIGPRGELFLALRGTRFRNPAYSGLRFDTVRDTFLDPRTKAANRAVIIDSCFSGRAIGPTLSAGTGALADELEISGSYTLASAPPNSVALVREGEAHTAFSGRLLRLLREGSPQSGDLISLREIYRHLHTRLRADGLPLPQARGTATADSLGLVRNARPAPVVPEPLAPEVLTVTDTAGQVLVTRPGGSAVRPDDAVLRRHAAAILDDVERIVPSIAAQAGKAEILAEVARLLALIDSQARLACHRQGSASLQQHHRLHHQSSSPGPHRRWAGRDPATASRAPVR